MERTAAEPIPDGADYRWRARPAPVVLTLTDEQRRVVDNDVRRLRVLAGPGTGKTTTLVETVAARIEQGRVPAGQILVLTFSRQARRLLADRIAARVAVTTREPIVRTVHSYAFALVRELARLAGDPPPRLLAAGEADQMVRELLAGHAAAGGGPWPDFLRGALRSAAFSDELTDLLARTAARGIPPARIGALARRRTRPEWSAAAAFAREYQQVSDLRQGSTGLGASLDQAELTAAALAALGDDRILAGQQSRFRRIYVDEYQDVDPVQAAMIDRLAAAADEFVVVGDPDQSVYAFRGSEPGAIGMVEVDRTVALTWSARLPADIVAATRQVAALLPGPIAHRGLLPAQRRSSPVVGRAGAADSVEVKVFPHRARQAAAVADELRRHHLLDGVAWSAMAVVCRSPGSSAPALVRAFAAAGIPLVIAGTERREVADPVVAALIGLLRYAADPSVLTGSFALELAGSPLAGLDAMAVRRLRRGLRADDFGGGSTPELLAAVLAGAPVPAGLPPDLRVPVERLRDLLHTALSAAAGQPVGSLLGRLWEMSGIESQLVTTAERGGRAGLRADRTLDAVIELFAVVDEVTAQLPMAGTTSVVDAILGRQIASRPDDPRPGADAVVLLSAHAAKGLEWDVVVLPDVQEGTWPDLRHRARLLRADELLDAAAAVPPHASRISELLAQERRLFYVATTRARAHLLCTAVADQDTAPSRFLEELVGADRVIVVPTTRGQAERPLHLRALVAELRIQLSCADDRTRAEAAGVMAELALAGVPGAHPRDWHGLASSTTQEPPLGPRESIRLSPSAVESLSTCALRTVLERAGGAPTAPSLAQVEGVVVHALAQGLAAGATVEQLDAAAAGFLASQIHLPPWQIGRLRRVLATMVSAAHDWQRSNHPPRTLVGAELSVDATLPATDAEPHPVRLVGRMDWLSRLPDGRLRITDFKTGATPPTRAQAEGNAQLAAYQVALSCAPPSSSPDGSASAGRPHTAADPGGVGGAELVYLRVAGPKSVEQQPLDEPGRRRWTDAIRTLAQQLADPTLVATQNPRCERCPVRHCCPIQPEGRQVTQ